MGTIILDKIKNTKMTGDVGFVESDQPKSVKIVLMRHGGSTSNEGSQKIREKHGFKGSLSETPDLTEPSLQPLVADYRQFYSSDSPEILNSILSKKGISQCKEASKFINEKFLNIKKVLVSPYRRTLQTFENSFSTYPR